MADPILTRDLNEQAKTVRKEVLTMIHTAGSGHPGGSLSAAVVLCQEKVQIKSAFFTLSYPAKTSAFSFNAA